MPAGHNNPAESTPVSRVISWEDLPGRLAELAGRAPLPDGRSLKVVRSSLTLHRAGTDARPRVYVECEDELDSIRIRTGKDRILIDVQQARFIVLRGDFGQAIETDVQGQSVEVDISVLPDLTVNVQFEHF